MPEDRLPENHRARLLWRIVETLDLSAFTAGAKAVEGQQGRARVSVHMLLTLWLCALSTGGRSLRSTDRGGDGYKFTMMPTAAKGTKTPTHTGRARRDGLTSC